MSLSNTNSFILLDGVGFGLRTAFQALFAMEFEDPAQRLVHRVLLQQLLASERRAAGSFDACLKSIIERSHEVCASGRIVKPTRRDIGDLVERVVPSSTHAGLASMIIDALELAGFNGRISVEKTSSRTHVERVNGCCFRLKPAIDVLGRSYVKPRVIVIDGHIERVSEAHALFEQIAESKQPCILFVRELSDDVKHTIKVNFDRGTMVIVPYIVTFDLEGANTLVDIAVASSNDVVSTMKGESIQRISLLEHSIVDRVDVSHDSITVVHEIANSSIAAHKARLQERMESAPDEQRHFFEHRVASLGAGTTYIRIKDGPAFPRESLLIDFALRVVRSALDTGVVHVDGVVLPAVQRLCAHEHARAFRRMIDDLGALIL